MLTALLAFSFLIITHELGHFMAARWAGINVLEFSIGMGPKLFAIKRGGTKYTLRLLPLGGYVRMEDEIDGMSLEEDENMPPREEIDRTELTGISFQDAPIFKRWVVLFAGSAMNLLTALFAMVLIVSSMEDIPSTTVGSYREENLSSSYGLEIGDRITKIEDDSVHISSDIIYALLRSNGQPLDITVEREGSLLLLQDVHFPTFESDGISYSTPDFLATRLDKTPLVVISESFYRSVSIVKEVYMSFVGLITGQVPLTQLSGFVATTQAIDQVAQQGFDDLVYFMVFISINIGVLNLLPFPALDGGRILFLLLELIRGKPMKREAEGWLNFIGFAALMTLVVYVTFQDIMKIAG